jgi:hypothetical protein
MNRPIYIRSERGNGDGCCPAGHALQALRSGFGGFLASILTPFLCFKRALGGAVGWLV